MIVGYTGTRYGMTAYQIITLTNLLIELAPDEGIHGCCIGGDSEFHGVLRNYFHGIKITGHPPKDKKQVSIFCLEDCDSLEEEEEFLKRDLNIVLACEFLIAAPNTEKEVLRSGTWTTVRYARKENRRHVIIFPNGLTKTNFDSSDSY